MKRIYLLVLVFLAIACSNDDDRVQNDPQENEPLGNFTLTVDKITPFSAELNWTIPENAENTNVVYSIYLDDVLQQENVTTTTFLLEELSPLTDYTLKVIATNETSSKESSLIIRTLEIPTLLVSKLVFNNVVESYFDISYGEDNQVESILYRPEPNDTYFDHTIDFGYDNKGRLITHQESGWDFRHTHASFTYSGNLFDEISVTIYSVDYIVNEEYDYSEDFASYNYSRTWNENGTGGLTENSENTLLKDSQNRITQHYKIDAVENFEKIYEFEYQNENLTKISDSEGNVWEIKYDNHSNFNTFYAGSLGGDPYPRGYVAGLHSLNDEDLRLDLARIPDFIGYKNKNNPVEYKKNGSVLRTIQYEYNEFNYPSKYSLEDGKECLIEYK